MSLPSHLYEPDRAAPRDHKGRRPCAHCPLPRDNRVHDLPDTSAEQAEERRRVGEEP